MSMTIEVGELQVPPKPSSRVGRWWREFGRPPRIMGVDVARALAIVGMIGAHVGATPELVWSDPSTWAGIVHGRSSVLFAVLAGVSVAIVTGRSTPLPPERIPAARLRLVGRGLAVLLIGILLELANTNIAVILGIYGLLFVIAALFIHWSARRLFGVGIVVALLGPPLLAFLQNVMMSPFGAALGFLVYGTYPITAWIAYLLIGMGVGRLGFDTVKGAVALLGFGVVLAVTAYGLGALVAPADGEEVPPDGSSSWEDPGFVTKPGPELDLDGFVCEIYEDTWISCYPEEKGGGVSSSGETIDGYEEDEYDYAGQLDWGGIWSSVKESVTSTYPHSGAVLDIAGTTGVALAALGLCILLSRPLRYLLLPIAALGSMPLSAYTAHVLSVVALAGGPGGYMPSSNGVWLWSVVMLVAAALLWANVFGKGPLERLVARAGAAMARPPQTAP